MTNNSALETLNPLHGLLPADIAAVFSARLPVEASLLGVETKLAQKMAEKRYNEFIHGRHCARLALAQLGIAPGPIDKGASREPLWPETISGSISHTLHYAAAAVAPRSAYVGIGLDMESAIPLEEKLFTAICRKEELLEFSRLKLTAEAAGERAKLLFSIKESIYKCLWPTVRQFIDFTEMQVKLADDGFSYQAIPHTTKASRELLSQLQGRYRYDGELILSSAWLSSA
jgi:4'-phosphopantetheinyl transferase EntD